MTKAGIKAIFVFAATVSLPAQPPAPAIITSEAILNAPLDDVWKAWTTREGIESWMVAKTDFKLEIGATWRTSYSKESTLDDDSTIQHLILAYDQGRMLAFRTVKPPKGFPFPSALAKTWTVVYLEPRGAAKTHITVRMNGYTEDEESQKMRAFFERGNRITLESLVKRFEK